MLNRKSLHAVFPALLSALIVSPAALGDIYQWEWVDPADPSQGRQASSTLCPDGLGLVPQPWLDARNNNLTQAWLPGTDLTRANFSGATLTDADLTQANLTNTTYIRATLANADLTGATIARADFEGATLTNADLTQATLTDADFEDATLTDTDLTRANLTDATFESTTLTDADLTRANLTHASFVRATLTNVNFTGANLTYADFWTVTLTDADFTGANLTDADFWAVTWTDADFTGADARGAGNISYTAAASRRNFVQPDGQVAGALNVVAGEQFRVWDYDGKDTDGDYAPDTLLGITVLEEFVIDDAGLLIVGLEDDVWGSTIAFGAGISVTFDGTLEVELRNGFMPIVGDQWQLFDFAGVTPMGGFDTFVLPTLAGGMQWDTANLMNTGVLAVVVPEPTSLLIMAGVLTATTIRRRR